MLDRIFSQLSAVSGFGNLALQGLSQMSYDVTLAYLATSAAGLPVNTFTLARAQAAMFLHNNPWVGASLGAMGLGLSAYSTYRLAQSVFANGFSMGAVANIGMTAFGMSAGVGSVMSGMGFLSSNPGMFALFTNPLTAAVTLAVMGAMFAVAYFTQRPPAEIAAEKLNNALQPIVWAAGPIVFLAAGAIAMAAGWRQGMPQPTLAQITMPSYHLNQMMQGQVTRAQNIDAKGPVTFVEPATGRVMIASSAGVDRSGNAMTHAQVFTLKGSLNISAPSVPGQSYIPFFVWQNGKPVPNPEVQKSFQTQMAMLSAVQSGRLDGPDALNGLLVASSANKYGATPLANEY